MPSHEVVLDNSFVEYFGDLDQVIQDQIRYVWENLEHEAYYVPPEAEYTVEERGDDYRACQHISGWNGLVLAWFFEYYATLPTTVEYVVLLLEPQDPPQRLEPRQWDS